MKLVADVSAGKLRDEQMNRMLEMLHQLKKGEDDGAEFLKKWKAFTQTLRKSKEASKGERFAYGCEKNLAMNFLRSDHNLDDDFARNKHPW